MSKRARVFKKLNFNRSEEIGTGRGRKERKPKPQRVLMKKLKIIVVEISNVMRRRLLPRRESHMIGFEKFSINKNLHVWMDVSTEYLMLW